MPGGAPAPSRQIEAIDEPAIEFVEATVAARRVVPEETDSTRFEDAAQLAQAGLEHAVVHHANDVGENRDVNRGASQGQPTGDALDRGQPSAGAQLPQQRASDFETDRWRPEADKLVEESREGAAAAADIE